MSEIRISMSQTDEFASRRKQYFINFRVIKDDREFYYAFLNHEKFNEEDGKFINLFKLIDEGFLRNNNIDYITDKDNNVIPIGIIDFQRHDERCDEDVLTCVVGSSDKLYKCNRVIDNIVEAIKIKYESEKFKKMCRTSYSTSSRIAKEINLD